MIYIKRLVLYNQFKTCELIYACLKANNQIYIWWTNHQNDMQAFDPKLWILTLYFNFPRQPWSPCSYLLFWGVSLACFYSFSWEAGEGYRWEHLPPSNVAQVPIDMWAEFVLGSLLCPERFFSGYSGFPLFLKTNTSKFQCDQEPVGKTKNH